MATSRNSKSSGMRILWIPGKRKTHPKGRYESTSKEVSYNSTPQKKNQLWSLGGSKTHKDLLKVDSDTNLLDGPSVSGLSSLTSCSIAAGAIGTAACKPIIDPPTEDKPSDTPLEPSKDSTESTAITLDPDESNKMPAVKLTSPPAAAVTTTTVAEIIEENRFAALSQNGSDDIDVYDLPTPPKSDPNWRDNLRLNTSGDTTNSIMTPVSSTSPSETKSNASSPSKKKLPHNHSSNHNQVDVNSIESISECDQVPKLDLDWIDDLVLEHNAEQMLRKNSKHKKKKHTTAKELDQLDGVPIKENMKVTTNEKTVEDDDKVVKCLYYTLMCCECSIS